LDETAHSVYTDCCQDHFLVKVDLSYSWNVLNNDRPITYVSSPDPSNHPPSSLIESGIFYDNEIFYIYGGGLAASDRSAFQPIITTPIRNEIWSFSNSNDSWSSTRIKELTSSYAPMHALSVQAPEQGLFFYFNGILNNGSSESPYPHMIIINTRTNDVRIVSTGSISPGTARVGAILQYLPLLGTRGALVLFGGATRHNDNMTTDPWGTMVANSLPKTDCENKANYIQVPLDTIHVFDIASLDSTPNGIWYRQRTSGRTPQPRLATCAINIQSPDNTSYHMYVSYTLCCTYLTSYKIHVLRPLFSRSPRRRMGPLLTTVPLDASLFRLAAKLRSSMSPRGQEADAASWRQP